MPNFLPIEYDTLPTCDDGNWMLHVQHYDYENDKYVLVGPCGDVTYEEEDFPTKAQQHAWWMRYWSHVMTFGNDPLTQIIPPTKRHEVDERWQLSFTRRIDGLILYARMNGRGEWLSGEAIPEYLREFMLAKLTFINNEPTIAVMYDKEVNTLARLKASDEAHDNLLVWGSRPPTSEGAGKHAWCWLNLHRSWTETLLDSAWYKQQGRDAYNVEKINYEHAKELEREPSKQDD